MPRNGVQPRGETCGKVYYDPHVADLNDPCLACEIVAGRVVPPGGVLARWPDFVLHGVAMASPVAGWVVLTPTRHARSFADLTDAEAAHLGVLAVAVQRAQRTSLGADHGYAAALGDLLHHVHLHLVPRYPTTPDRLRGARAFLADPKDARPEVEIDAACAALARAVRDATRS